VATSRRVMTAQMAEPLRVTGRRDTHTSVKLAEGPAIFIVDMGQNMVGSVPLKVVGRRGAQSKRHDAR